MDAEEILGEIPDEFLDPIQVFFIFLKKNILAFTSQMFPEFLKVFIIQNFSVQLAHFSKCLGKVFTYYISYLFIMIFIHTISRKKMGNSFPEIIYLTFQL